MGSTGVYRILAGKPGKNRQSKVKTQVETGKKRQSQMKTPVETGKNSGRNRQKPVKPSPVKNGLGSYDRLQLTAF